MRGTLVCAVTEGVESAAALSLSTGLSERLGLRLVLAQAVDGMGGDGRESVTIQAGRQGASAAWRAWPRNTGWPTAPSAGSPLESRPRGSGRSRPRRRPT
jgi:hypothetical protein